MPRIGALFYGYLSILILIPTVINQDLHGKKVDLFDRSQHELKKYPDITVFCNSV